MKKLLLYLLILVVILAVVAWIRYGGGKPYPNLSTAPVLRGAILEEVLSFPEPIGNVAVSEDNRVFFTVHPEARPEGNRLLEYVNGAAVPYPSVEQQHELFDTPLGVVIDRQEHLWTIDHGNHGMRVPRMLAFDLRNGEVVLDVSFPDHIAPAGSFLQDLQVSADGGTVVIADASFWRKKPALIIYDVETGSMRRILEGHPSVAAENYVIRNGNREMTFVGGIVSLRGGVDGIALGPDWLYFGALSGSGLYRIRLLDLRDDSTPDEYLERRVERYATKPLSDGLSVDVEGNVYMTDIEHGSIWIVDGSRDAKTLIRSDNIRWPDALSFGPDGWLYIADSALAEIVLQSREHIKSQAPYYVFRFQPGTEGVPGQ